MRAAKNAILAASIFSALLLVGCAEALMKANGLSPVVRTPLTEAENRAVEAGLRRVLKDPDSARFGEFIGGRNEQNALVVCGYVNGRNSFGGMTGPEPFNGVFQADNSFFVTGLGSGGSSSQAIRMSCGVQNLPLDAVATTR